MMVSRRDAVLQHEGRDAEGVQPACDLIAFVILSQGAVSSAWTDNDSGTGGIFFGRQIQSQAGLIDILGTNGSGRPGRPQQFNLVRRRMLRQHSSYRQQ